MKRLGQREHWKVAGCFWTRESFPPAAEARDGSAKSRMASRFGIDEVEERRDLLAGEASRESGG